MLSPGRRQAAAGGRGIGKCWPDYICARHGHASAKGFKWGPLCGSARPRWGAGSLASSLLGTVGMASNQKRWLLFLYSVNEQVIDPNRSPRVQEEGSQSSMGTSWRGDG